MCIRCFFGLHEWEYAGGGYTFYHQAEGRTYVGIIEDCAYCDARRYKDWRIRPNGGLTPTSVNKYQEES
jgi:hypothetical protein